MWLAMAPHHSRAHLQTMSVKDLLAEACVHLACVSPVIPTACGHRSMPLAREHRHGCEILPEVELKRVDNPVGNVGAPVSNTDCVTIRYRAHDTRGTDATAGTDHILNNKRLPEEPSHVLSENARDGVRWTASRSQLGHLSPLFPNPPPLAASHGRRR